MTDYRLPPGMTAKNLRFIADDLRSHNFVVFANTLGSWADAIDPPAPKSIATDEMVDEVAAETYHPTGDGHLSLGMIRGALEAAVACGWTPPRDLESSADNPSPSVEPWPTDEQVDAAADAILDRCYGQELPEAPIDLARAALEAVAPPPVSDDVTERLAMAERLLRAVLAVSKLRTYGRDGAGWWDTNLSCLPTTADEAEYLRSLAGEGDSDD